MTSVPSTVPDGAGNVAVAAKATPSPDTSNPAGAVAVMSPSRSAPVTTTLPAAEGVPETVVNAARLPVTVIEGTAAPGRATETSVMPIWRDEPEVLVPRSLLQTIWKVSPGAIDRPASDAERVASTPSPVE